MDELTRWGIAYNLEVSPYKLKVEYNSEVIEYVFSSELYKSIFQKKIHENRKKITDSLTNRFGIELEIDLLADIKLYTTVEKRGFLIKNIEESYKCLNNIKLSGLMTTLRN